MSTDTRPPETRGFFRVSRFRLWSTIALVVLAVLTLNPFTYGTQIGGTSLINWMLCLVMVAAFVVVVIDLIVTRNDAPTEERNDV